MAFLYNFYRAINKQMLLVLKGWLLKYAGFISQNNRYNLLSYLREELR